VTAVGVDDHSDRLAARVHGELRRDPRLEEPPGSEPVDVGRDPPLQLHPVEQLADTEIEALLDLGGRDASPRADIDLGHAELRPGIHLEDEGRPVRARLRFGPRRDSCARVAVRAVQAVQHLDDVGDAGDRRVVAEPLGDRLAQQVRGKPDIPLEADGCDAPQGDHVELERDTARAGHRPTARRGSDRLQQWTMPGTATGAALPRAFREGDSVVGVTRPLR
jgi:hypothetical protein